jgi:SRSO17 transposase
MVCAPAIKLQEIGDHYGFRTWIEYGLKQAKDALGWADFRITGYEQIEKWWELVMSAFWMVSLFADGVASKRSPTSQAERFIRLSMECSQIT